MKMGKALKKLGLMEDQVATTMRRRIMLMIMRRSMVMKMLVIKSTMNC